MGMLNLDFR